MVNICLIGCGRVGRRHLEAMLKVKHEVNIEVVEPNTESINSTKELLPDFNNYFSRIEDVSDNIDICLIATASSVRKKVILNLLKRKTVKNIILEKVVFQNENDFDSMVRVFDDININCWVNCHLRAQPIYKTLKSYINSERSNIFRYNYSDDFTLSSSAIHILDLFSYLCDDYNVVIKSIDTGTKLEESRHSGCVDFNGNMEVINSKGDTLFVTKRDAIFGEHMSVSNYDKVYLETDWANKFSVDTILIIEAYRALDPSTYPQVYNDMFLKKYATALIKQQWGSNLKKFTGVTLPGGISLDGQTIFSEATEEIIKIEEEMNLKYELPPDGMIG